MKQRIEQWDVWEVNQVSARASSAPPQPNDAQRQTRPFVVVAPNLTGYQSVTCCPIQDFGQGATLTQVELQKGYGGFIKKDSKVMCHDIFTLPSSFLLKKLGEIEKVEQDKIQDALITHLGL